MDASEFLNYKNWVVIGDVINPSKYAFRILTALKEADFNVVGVNPSEIDNSVYKSLEEVPYKIDVLDLCMNPHKAIKILQGVEMLKINKVLIQPGAESDEIINFCKKAGMAVIEGCALVELSKR